MDSMARLSEQLDDKEILGAWKLNKPSENEVRLELYDDYHSIPKHTVVIDASLEFIVFCFQWPIPDDHSIYKNRNRNIRQSSIDELLRLVETSVLCKGLPDIDEVKNDAVDTTVQVHSSGTIIRHSVPKNLSNEQVHHEVSVSFRSVNCKYIFWKKRLIILILLV